MKLLNLWLKKKTLRLSTVSGQAALSTTNETFGPVQETCSTRLPTTPS